MDGDIAILWSPDAGKFAKIVADGKLPGAMDGNNVRLGELTPDQLKSLKDETWGVPFAWDEPLVLKRVEAAK